MRILNLYAGIGGNRLNWRDVDVVAVESNPKIASVYRKLHPDDEVIVGDAHDYLLNHLDDFDFVWSSPPCQTHSRMAVATRHKRKRYVDLRLYEEIMFLQRYGKAWVVENVRPFYAPLIDPTFTVGRHLFWSSSVCNVEDIKRPKGFINATNMAGRAALQDWLGMHFDDVIYYEGNHCPAQILRNAVHPSIGLDVLSQVIKKDAEG